MAFPAIPSRVVLVHPSLPENVGSVARAMRHFGQGDLVLVGSSDLLDDPAAIATSAGASAILDSARRVETLEDALEGSALVVGTTARIKDRPDLRTELLASALPDIRAHANTGRPVTWVFGTERHGLTREQTLRCDRIVRIPGEEGTCLNLAMAVNIVLYTCYLESGDPVANDPGTGWLREAAPDLFATLDAILQERGFWRPGRAASKRHTFRRMASRILLDRDEVRLLEAALRVLAPATCPSTVLTSTEEIGQLTESPADPA